MKLLAMAAVTLLFFSHSAEANLRPGETEAYAEIVGVKDNRMFPVRTVALTAMQPCGSRMLGAYAVPVSAGRVEVGVRLAVRAGGAFCLAMPRPVGLQVAFRSETPAEISVRNLTRKRFGNE